MAARGDADQRRPLGPAEQERARERPRAVERHEHDADRPEHDRRRAEPGHRFAEEDEAEHGGLDHLGLGVGDADGEIPVGEGVEQQRGRDDLRDGAQRHPRREAPIEGGQVLADAKVEQQQIEDRERKAEGVARVGRRVGAEPPLQVLLERRADVLQQRRGDRDGDPEPGHGRRWHLKSRD
jgi:hypothetical protein